MRSEQNGCWATVLYETDVSGGESRKGARETSVRSTYGAKHCRHDHCTVDRRVEDECSVDSVAPTAAAAVVAVAVAAADRMAADVDSCTDETRLGPIDYNSLSPAWGRAQSTTPGPLNTTRFFICKAKLTTGWFKLSVTAKQKLYKNCKYKISKHGVDARDDTFSFVFCSDKSENHCT